MKGKILFFILLILIPINTSFSQSYHSSIIFESACLFSETRDLFAIDNSEYLYGFCISQNNVFRLNENYQIEIRPGYFFTDMYFHGVQVGLFAGIKINKQILYNIGLTSNFNLFNDSGHRSDPKFFSMLASIGLKIKHGDNFSTLISLYKTFDDLYGHGYKALSNSSKGTVYFSKRLNWVFRLGLEYEL